jgi:hypothetical protein
MVVGVRLILDTNLWSRLADQGQARRFGDAAKARGIEIFVPPTVLFELGRVPNLEVRRRHLSALFSVGVTRLRREGQLSPPSWSPR